MALKEVCIAARTFGPGRAQEGDIIVIREPIGAVGTSEQNDFIWLLVDDADLPDPSDLRREGSQHKFQHRIDLATISGLNLSRARDPQDRYQPFITVGQQGRITASQTRRVTTQEKV